MDDGYRGPIPAGDGFSRALDWRWQRANYYATYNLRARHDDDRETKIAADYRRDREAGNRRPPRQLRETWAAIAAARALAARDNPVRWQLEARLLAGQDDHEIAHQCGLDPAVVQWYEALAFCVRDRLTLSDWIASRTYGPALWSGAMKLSDVWRYVAYTGGPVVLDAMIAGTSVKGGETDGTSSRARPPFSDEVLESARIVASVHMLPVETSVSHWSKLLEQGERAKSMRSPASVADVIARDSERLLEATKPSPTRNSHRKPRQAGIA